MMKIGDAGVDETFVPLRERTVIKAKFPPRVRGPESY